MHSHNVSSGATMAATEQERTEDLDHLLELRDTHRAHKRELQRQLAQFGRAAPPHLRTELAEVNRELERIAGELPTASAPAYLDRMSSEEQAKYLVTLVMALQADFVGCRVKLNRDVKLLCRVLIALQIALLVIVASMWLPQVLG